MLGLREKKFVLATSGTDRHVPEKQEKNFVSNLKQKLKPKLNLLIKSFGDQSSPAMAPNLMSLKLP